MVWDSWLGAQAYGVIAGDTHSIRAPWNAELREVHVVEGARVSEGQRLAVLVSRDMFRSRERLEAQLNVEQAKLAAESARLRIETSKLRSESTKLESLAHKHAAEYFEFWGSYLKETQELKRLTREFERAEKLGAVMTASELEKIEFAREGQQELVKKMEEALQELRRRIEPEAIRLVKPDVAEALKPILAQMDFLRSEIQRIEDQISEGELRSPVNGYVVRVHRCEKERVDGMSALIDIVDIDSVHAKLYVPQKNSDEFQERFEVELQAEPFDEAITWHVTGRRQRYETAPTSIQRYYRSNQPLMPVLLKPKSTDVAQELRIGAIVKLPLVNVSKVFH